MSSRHAYLIICHHNFEQLSTLLSLLDHPNNDIYIHVDKKSGDFPKSMLYRSVNSASLEFIKRQKTNWGGHSQITVELSLLEAATKTKHSYYHLISGTDLPIKSQSLIHKFFAQNHGKEFIEINERLTTDSSLEKRIKHFHFFQDFIGRNHGKHIAVLELIENASLRFQEKHCLSRIAHASIEFVKGPNWFSITHNLALYVLSQKKLILKHFCFSICADEMFLQSVAVASPYAGNIAGTTMRYVDWHRGSPYTFTYADKEALLQSPMLFARKFDDKVDAQIIDYIANSISS